MSKFKVGDKVKVRNAGRGTDGWVGDVEKIDKKINYVRFKEEGYVIGFYDDELEVIPRVKPTEPPTQTKMLHELITLHRAGKKFKMWRVSPPTPRGDKIEYNQNYLHKTSWSADDVVREYFYEEIKEPRVLELELDWSHANKNEPVRTINADLAGTKWKAVFTEVIE